MTWPDRGGSFGANDLSSHVDLVGGGWSASATGSRFGTNGTYDFNNGYRNTVGSLALGLNAKQSGQAALTVRYGDAVAHFPTDGGGNPLDHNQFTTERSLAAGLVVSRSIGTAASLHVQAFASRLLQGYTNREDSPADTTGFDFVEDRTGTTWRRGGDARLDWRLNAATLFSFGAGLEHETDDEHDVGVSNFGFGVSHDTAAFAANRTTRDAYVQALANPASNVSLQLGARLDDNSAFGAFGTWRVGAAWHAQAGARIWAAAGTAFKAPTFSQLFASSAFEVGNPDLAPERSENGEIGAEAPVADRRVRFGATFFWQHFRDLIQYVGAAPGAPTYLNLGGANSRGLEATMVAQGFIPGDAERALDLAAHRGHRHRGRVVTNFSTGLSVDPAPRAERRCHRWPITGTGSRWLRRDSGSGRATTWISRGSPPAGLLYPDIPRWTSPSTPRSGRRRAGHPASTSRCAAKTSLTPPISRRSAFRAAVAPCWPGAACGSDATGGGSMRAGRRFLLLVGIALAACAPTLGPTTPPVEVLVVLDSLDETLRIIPVDSPSIVHHLAINTGSVAASAFALRDRIAAIGFGDSVTMIDLGTHQTVCKQLLNGKGPVGSLTFDNVGHAFAGTPKTDSVALIDVPHGCGVSTGSVRGRPLGFGVDARGTVFALVSNPTTGWLISQEPLRDSISLGTAGEHDRGGVRVRRIVVRDQCGRRQLQWRAHAGRSGTAHRARCVLGIWPPADSSLATDGADHVYVASPVEGLMVFNVRTHQVERGAGPSAVALPGGARGLATDDFGRIYTLITGPCGALDHGFVQPLDVNLVAQHPITVGRCPIAIGVTEIPAALYHFDN